MKSRLLALAVLGISLGCQNTAIYDLEPNMANGVSAPVPSALVTPVCEAPSVTGLSGRIHVSVVVNSDGSVSDARVHSSEVTKAGCDEAAVRAIRQWRFKPGLKDGRPVAVRVITGYSFPFPDSLEPGLILVQ
jgi:TonB family protein